MINKTHEEKGILRRREASVKKKSWKKARQGFVSVKIYFCQNTEPLSTPPVF